MSYRLAILKDSPMAFWPLEESSGTTLNDISPAQNSGSYSTTIVDAKEIPLVTSLSSAFRNRDETLTFSITKNYDQKLDNPIFSSDNDFSLEAWFYPQSSYDVLINIIANSSEDMGIFYDSGTILFSVYGNEIRHTLSNTDQSVYIAATYSPGKMSLYINGILKSSLSITNLFFSEEEETFISGPTGGSTQYYLINAVAIYRYALTQAQILSHYNQAQSIPALQIVTPHAGDLFELYDDNISTQFNYSYPGNKSWDYFIADNLSYNQVENKLYIPSGIGDPQSIQILDYISMPSGITITDSKIEWDGDNGIEVKTSLDGISYTSCINGQSIPGYELTSDGPIENRSIHLEITISTDDDSKYNPELNYLSLTFYKNQLTYANNSSSYLEVIEATELNSPVNVSLSNYKYPILSRHSRNGAKVLAGSSFIINPVSEVSTIEFFYTPASLYSTLLFEATGASYGSTGMGGIQANNIDSLFVNGSNKISESNIYNVLSPEKIHHIVAVLTEPISGPITFQISNNAALYQNIAVYSKQLSSSEAVSNYQSYIGTENVTVLESAMTMTEEGIDVYDNDWIVVQNS